MTNFSSIYGQNQAHTGLADHNTIAFMIAQQLKAVSTATICKVVSCTVAGAVGPIGQVDVQPLVDLQDGIGKTSKHLNVQKIPYLRMQGGSKAIILDPKAGDLALVVFADRDTSAVRKNKKESSPGSRRRFNMADGMYVGTLLADAPTSYVQFEDDGTVVISPDNGTTVVKVKANDVTVTIGSTVFEVKPDEIHAKAGLEVWIRPARVDLGKKDALHKVMTEDGPSEKVYAIIDESP